MKENNNAYAYISIVAIVAIVSLFVMFAGNTKETSQPIVLSGGFGGDLVGDARHTRTYEIPSINYYDDINYYVELIDAGRTNNIFKLRAVFELLEKENFEIIDFEEIGRRHGRITSYESIGDSLRLLTYEDGKRWFTLCFCDHPWKSCKWSGNRCVRDTCPFPSGNWNCFSIGTPAGAIEIAR